MIIKEVLKRLWGNYHDAISQKIEKKGKLLVSRGSLLMFIECLEGNLRMWASLPGDWGELKLVRLCSSLCLLMKIYVDIKDRVLTFSGRGCRNGCSDCIWIPPFAGCKTLACQGTCSQPGSRPELLGSHQKFTPELPVGHLITVLLHPEHKQPKYLTAWHMGSLESGLLKEDRLESTLKGDFRTCDRWYIRVMAVRKGGSAHHAHWLTVPGEPVSDA